MKRAVFIDGTSLAYRAFHALPSSLKTSDGLPTNALFGFVQAIRKILAGKTPAVAAVALDTREKTFRAKADAAYKAHREGMPAGLREQMPHLASLCRAHNLPVVALPGFEADDVVGTLTQRAVDAGYEVWVVGGDKDYAQLVCDEVKWFEPTSEVLHDAERVFRKFGVYPGQFVDWLALVGDSADNIAGVPGIGKKRASELLTAHGSLSALKEQEPRVAKHWERATKSQFLATIVRDAPIGVELSELVFVKPKAEAANEVYRAFEFFSLLSAEALSVVPKAEVEYFVCDTLEQAAVAVHVETQTDEPIGVHVLTEFGSGEVVGVALSPSLGRGIYLPRLGEGGLGDNALLLLKKWLADPSKPKVIHNSFGARVALGGELEGVVADPALASYLVDPTRNLPHRLEQIAREYLHIGMQPVRGVLKGKKSFSALSLDRAGAWACHNADAAAAAWEALRPHLHAEGHARLFAEVDLPLTAVLAGMTAAGIAADRDALDELGVVLAAERDSLRAQCERLAGRAFHPGSHKQLGTVLFGELGLPVIKRTKTGWSTSAEVLDKLAGAHPIVGVVKRWRTVDNLINTYTRVLAEAIEEDGRIRPTYQQTVSSSGRIITTEPDLQRTPVRTPEFRQLRKAFVAAEGHALVSADWSQMELRLLAHFSGDEVLVGAYERGEDVHAQTAAALFSLLPHEVTPELRNVGKTVNFATIYGQGPKALAVSLGIEQAAARTYIRTFFALYAGVKRWRERVVAAAYADGFVTTLAGRRRYVPQLSANNPTDRAYGERIATNTPIQGSGADLCKLALLRLHECLAGTGSRMVLQIHDEILIEAPHAEVELVCEAAREVMSSVWELAVPLVVDVGSGASWDEAHS